MGRLATGLILILALAGCGFQPLYGTRPANLSDRPMNQALARIETGIIPDRTGALLRGFLQAGLTPKGVDGVPGFRLSVELAESEEEVAFRRDDTATRVRLNVIATFKLHRSADGAIIHGGKSRAVGSYNILDDYYATLASQEQARRTAAEQLARDIQRRLAVFLQRNPAAHLAP